MSRIRVKPIPPLPFLSEDFPKIVEAFDKIRFEIDGRAEDDYGEFSWFAREYPRCYRYHLAAAEFRLKTIRSLFEEIRHEIVIGLKNRKAVFSMSVSNTKVLRIYWDFESLLSEISSALDLLARIVGAAFRDPMPISFNKLCRRKDENKMLALLKRAQISWIFKMKDYRDCFVHYTPVDTLLSVGASRYKNEFEIRAKIPTNPNVREILRFRYRKDTELLKYSYSVWRNMTRLDKAIANEIFRSYKLGQFPKRTSSLFFLGERER